ncbi:hypothetical protein niasHT_020399 [Heterodera trifolii]|uniref:Uncharacterized protein n=1 Tax=Heterodera trifolii TaxID=157864 RepID=A0ABD2JXE1_9BILA
MPSETDPHPNSPQITLIDNAPTLESSLPPAQSENPELNPPSPNTDYSSFPSDSAPASPNTEFVVTIPATGPTERPKIRAPSPRDQMTPRPIQVVTGITGRHSNNSNDFSLFSHPPHPMHTTPQRRFRPPRPRVISRVRIVGSGRVQHYPMDTQRTGWKKMAAKFDQQPVPLNLIHFDSPPNISAGRSIASCEINPSFPPTNCQIPVPLPIPFYSAQPVALTAFFPRISHNL